MCTDPLMCHKFMNSELIYTYFCVIKIGSEHISTICLSNRITYQGHKNFKQLWKLLKCMNSLTEDLMNPNSLNEKLNFTVLCGISKDIMNYTHEIRQGEQLTTLTVHTLMKGMYIEECVACRLITLSFLVSMFSYSILHEQCHKHCQLCFRLFHVFASVSELGLVFAMNLCKQHDYSSSSRS